MTRTRCWSPPDSRGHSLTLSYHADAAVIELALMSPETPTFTIATLDAFQVFVEDVRASARATQGRPWRYFHLTSLDPRTFSMGGDLQTIARIARERDRAEAREYGRKAAEVIYGLWNSFGLDLITTACVAGKAFGAGFEAALACNRAVAHHAASFCLPESRFGLFPGMGATSLLQRRLGQQAMEAMIAERSVMTAQDALRAGLLQTLCPSDPAAMEMGAAAAGGESRWATLMDCRTKTKAREAFSLDEVVSTTTRWAECVVSLPPADLEALERVARMQAGRSGAGKR